MTCGEKEDLTREATERDVRTAAEWKQLLRSYKPRRELEMENVKAWAAAMARAGADIDRMYPAFEWKNGDKLETQTMMAENMMVDSLQTPPHWKKTVWCKHCGPMPYSEDIQDALACPWCGVMSEQQKEVA